MLLNNHWITEEIKEEIILTDRWKYKQNGPQLMGYSKITAKRQCIAAQSHLKKQQKPQTNKLSLHPKPLEKEEQAKS